ncbi:hypothetical protein BDR07DRAFT_1372598 [Suillus spraguei]|nr:hypothetical protein BDR07DRAFT_1372598 [Suillus spraguei]
MPTSRKNSLQAYKEVNFSKSSLLDRNTIKLELPGAWVAEIVQVHFRMQKTRFYDISMRETQSCGLAESGLLFTSIYKDRVICNFRVDGSTGVLSELEGAGSVLHFRSLADVFR